MVTKHIIFNCPFDIVFVPDLGSRDRDVVLVRRTISSGKSRGSGIWNGEGMGKGRSVQEQPGAKVDGIASRQRRVSKYISKREMGGGVTKNQKGE
jgi:hypothetical protein